MVFGWNESPTEKVNWLPFDSSKRARTRSSGRSRSFFGRSLADESSFSSYGSSNSPRCGGFPRIPSSQRRETTQDYSLDFSRTISSFASTVMEEIQAFMETGYSSSDSDSSESSGSESSSESEQDVRAGRRNRQLGQQQQETKGLVRTRTPLWLRRNKNTGNTEARARSPTEHQDLQKESSGLSRTRSPLWWRRKKASKGDESQDSNFSQDINYSSHRPSSGSDLEVVFDSPKTKEPSKPASKQKSKRKIWRNNSLLRGRSTEMKQEVKRDESHSGPTRNLRWNFSGDEEDDIVANRRPVFPGDDSDSERSTKSASSADSSDLTAFMEESVKSSVSSVNGLISELDQGSSFFDWFKESEKNSAFRTLLPDLLFSMSDLSTKEEAVTERDDPSSSETESTEQDEQLNINMKLQEEEERFMSSLKLREEEELFISNDAQRIASQVGETDSSQGDYDDMMENILGQFSQDFLDEDQEPRSLALRRKSSISKIVFGDSVRNLFQRPSTPAGRMQRQSSDIVRADERASPQSGFVHYFQRQTSGVKSDPVPAAERATSPMSGFVRTRRFNKRQQETNDVGADAPTGQATPKSRFGRRFQQQPKDVKIVQKPESGTWAMKSDLAQILNKQPAMESKISNATNNTRPVKIKPIVVRRSGSNVSLELSIGEPSHNFVKSMIQDVTNNVTETATPTSYIEASQHPTGGFWRHKLSGFSRKLSGKGVGRLTCPSNEIYRSMSGEESDH